MQTDTPIFVFIDGPAPTEADRALFKEVGADQYLNRLLCAGAKPLPHAFAVAVDASWIPEGYRTEAVQVEAVQVAPPSNPDAPPAQPSALAGTLGVQADDTPPVAPGAPLLPVFGLKKD